MIDERDVLSEILTSGIKHGTVERGFDAENGKFPLYSGTARDRRVKSRFFVFYRGAVLISDAWSLILYYRPSLFIRIFRLNTSRR